MTKRSPDAVPFWFYTGFEDADRDAGGRLNLNSSGLSCQPDGMQVSTAHARLGMYSIRSIVRSNDFPKCGSSYRDEFLVTNNGADSIVKNRFYAFSFFPEDYYPGGVMDVRDELIMQFKNNSQDNYPFVAIWVRPDASGTFSNYVLVVKYGSVVADPLEDATATYILGRVTSDVWADFALDINWQANSTGSVKVYMNNNPTPVRTHNGQNMNPAWNNLAPRYPSYRCGIYKFPWSNNAGPFAINQRVAHYDEINQGSAGVITDYFVPANVPPVANAGTNVNMTLPENSTVLNGSTSNDADGFLTSYLWTKKSGPSTWNLSSATVSSPTLTNLVAGSYVFQLKVTDNAGAADSSLVYVNVSAAPVINQPPIASAGANQSIVLPAASVQLSGIGTDVDGTIASYTWTKDSGPGSYSFSSAGIANPVVSALTEGRYTFRLTVTDNDGSTGFSTVDVVVQAAPVIKKTIRLNIRKAQ